MTVREFRDMARSRYYCKRIDYERLRQCLEVTRNLPMDLVIDRLEDELNEGGCYEVA